MQPKYSLPTDLLLELEGCDLDWDYHKAVGVVTAALQRLGAAWAEKGYVVQSEHNHVTNLGVGINKAHKVVKIPVIPLRCY